MLARTPYHAGHVPFPDTIPSRIEARDTAEARGDKPSMTSGTPRMAQPDRPQLDAQWWITLAQRLNIEEKVEQFFHDATTPHNVLDRVAEVDGDMPYILFVLVRHWIPVVLPPPGRERVAKHDPDYWLESAHILEAAVTRLRELKPLIDLLTTPNPLAPKPAPSASPVVEVELANMLQDIAKVAGSYGGPDYTSTIKNFDPIPLRQTQPFKHNKKHSAELWVVFLLREHFRTLNLGKDRYWPLLTDVVTAAGIRQPNDSPFTPGELKSWWTKNWPRTYTLLKEKSDDGLPVVHTAYQSDYEWFQSWFMWELSQAAGPGR
ncbi:MAG: hypothetical protein OXF47_03330 [Nitrospira sp.]|nr:hypothetical protein [Nitrospira sp.]